MVVVLVADVFVVGVTGFFHSHIMENSYSIRIVLCASFHLLFGNRYTLAVPFYSSWNGNMYSNAMTDERLHNDLFGAIGERVLCACVCVHSIEIRARILCTLGSTLRITSTYSCDSLLLLFSIFCELTSCMYVWWLLVHQSSTVVCRLAMTNCVVCSLVGYDIQWRLHSYLPCFTRAQVCMPLFTQANRYSGVCVPKNRYSQRNSKTIFQTMKWTIHGMHYGRRMHSKRNYIGIALLRNIFFHFSIYISFIFSFPSKMRKCDRFRWHCIVGLKPFGSSSSIFEVCQSPSVKDCR